MKSQRFQYRSLFTPTVFLIVLGGVVLHIAGFLAIQPFWDELEPVEYPEPYIQIRAGESTPSGLVEAQYALLNDSAPLFIPTRWNYLSRIEFDGYQLPDPVTLFEPFPPRLSAASPDSFWFGSERVGADAGLERMLEFPPTSFFEGFGWRQSRVEPLPERPAGYSVENLMTGEIVSSGNLAPDQLPGSAGLSWQPVHYLLLVEPLGRVGRPLPLGSSGNEMLDQQIQEWLVKNAFWRNLEPGYYQIRIGP